MVWAVHSIVTAVARRRGRSTAKDNLSQRSRQAGLLVVTRRSANFATLLLLAVILVMGIHCPG